MVKPADFTFCVAPMMDWTDRHCRFFHRILSRKARLYSEMVTASAVIHGNRQKLLGFSSEEHPLALQLGGSDPAALAEAARIGESFGYDEINLNIGCPSDRVQAGRFGACLMREPKLVAQCFTTMQSAINIPVTIKCRLGVDDDDLEFRIFDFVSHLEDAGCETFIIHARRALLKGLSPKENRVIPELDYELAARLKANRPKLNIILNGGIENLVQCKEHLRRFDGVMLGRSAYQNPALLLNVDQELFGSQRRVNPIQALRVFRSYMCDELARGTPLHAMTRHILGLFNGRPNAKLWRRVLSGSHCKTSTGIEVFDQAFAYIE